jgi:3D (Asp-Asp-Asp) domain-containing protein
MIQAPTIPTSLLKRVARVSVIAVFTASTLALLGAGRVERAAARRTAKPVAVKQVVATSDNDAAWGELLVAENALPAKAVIPAVQNVPTFRTVRMEVTAYCPCVKCCGPNAQGITASGKLITHNGGKFVAADTSVLPFGKRLVIPGYADNQPVEVADRGGAIKGNKLDLFFATHEAALQWGRQTLEVTVLE